MPFKKIMPSKPWQEPSKKRVKVESLKYFVNSINNCMIEIFKDVRSTILRLLVVGYF